MRTGQMIQKLRKQNNMTQNELAQRLFVSRDLVAKWETGNRRPDHTAVQALAKLFSVAEDQLISKEELLLDELKECIPDQKELTFQVLTQRLNTFLQKQTKRDCRIFILRYYYGKSADEIANAYSLKKGSVYSVLSRLRGKLKQFLQEDEL